MSENRYYLLLVVFILLLAYILPVVVYFRPFGTDVYSHMVYNQKMFEASSLSEFYNKIYYDTGGDELGYGYPFGIWYFGAITAKVTGISAFEVAYLLPLLTTLMNCVLVFILSSFLLKEECSKGIKTLAIVFFLSMPFVAISLLRYQPSVFVTVILFTIFFVNHNHHIKLRKSIPLTAICVFALCISHSGTYLFLTSFALLYVLLKSTVWGLFQRRIFALVALILMMYALTMSVFTNIHTQYSTKSYFFVTVANSLANVSHISIISDIGRIFQREIFEDNNLLYAVIWSAVIYTVCKLIIFLRKRLSESINRQTGMQATIPLIGGIQNISHSITTTPFWAGPIHLLLTLPGVYRLNTKGRCMLLTAGIVILIPGAISTNYTGALRELYYLLVILPISAAAGFSYVSEVIYPKLKKRISYSQGLFLLFFFMTCLILIVTPIIGNQYYLLPTSGATYEIESLKALSKIGNPEEIAIAYGYRGMVRVYGSKETPSIDYGNENRIFLQNMLNTFFSKNWEDYSDGLYSGFRATYIISSDRVIRNLNATDGMIRGTRQLEYSKPGEVFLDINTNLDRIYSNEKNFGIYKFIPRKEDRVVLVNTTERIRYVEANNTYISDEGVTFAIRTDQYTVRLNKKKPQIIELRNNEFDYLNDGYMRDYMGVGFTGGPKNDYYKLVYFKDLNYTTTLLGGNQLMYSTIIQDNNDNLASFSVKYTFYQKAIKKEIIVSNDWISYKKDYSMTILLYNSLYLPLFSQVIYYEPTGRPVKKTIYPSDDVMKLKDISFNRVYLNNGSKGIYIQFSETNQYPDELQYKGAVNSKYSLLNIGVKRTLRPSETMHVTEYLSIGGLDLVEDNVKSYTDVEVYPYKNAIIPMVIAGYSQEGDEDTTEFTLSTLQKMNITYNGGIYLSGGFNSELATKSQVLGYDKLHNGLEYDGIQTQKEKISRASEARRILNTSLRGFIPLLFKYNLDTVSILQNEGFSYMIGQPSNLYYSSIYQYGRRSMSFLSLQGNQTDIVILPVTIPFVNKASSIDQVNLMQSWREIIDTSMKTEDVSTLVVAPEVFSSPTSSIILDIINYSQRNGLTVVSSDELVKHFKLIQNIDSMVEWREGGIKIYSHNGNREQINGLTYRITLPRRGDNCDYVLDDANIVRVKEEFNDCVLYVVLDLNANETRTFYISS